MNELYGLPDIPDTTFALAHHTDPVFRNAVDSSVRIDPATIARLTARIYKGDLDTSQDLDRDFYQAVASVMHDAVDKGLKEAGAHAPSSPDDYFHHQLTHSADVFAAFKVHRAQADIAAQLLDDDGHLRPFREFQQRVLPITSHQCGRWLRTEYDTAVIRAQRAAEWQQFLEEADVLPNLEWMPSTSAVPGADHQVFWGTILPISDPFWSEHRPGDRWNCKCSLQATDAKPTPRPRGFSEIANAPQPGLDSNPGTDGAVFSPSHPYFPPSCSQCPFKAPAAGVPTPSAATVPSGSPAGFSNAVKDCMHCAYANACINNVHDFDSRITPLSMTVEEMKERRKVIKSYSDQIKSAVLVNAGSPLRPQITMKGIKEWLNQPHTHYAEKNELLLDIGRVFAESTFVKTGIDYKDTDVKVHLFEITILGDRSWIIVREFPDGLSYIYSVSDQPSIIENVGNAQ